MKNDIVKFVSFIVQIFYVQNSFSRSEFVHNFIINKMNTLIKGNKN